MSRLSSPLNNLLKIITLFIASLKDHMILQMPTLVFYVEEVVEVGLVGIISLAKYFVIQNVCLHTF